jgi:excisionase family DNA binding protein
LHPLSQADKITGENAEKRVTMATVMLTTNQAAALLDVGPAEVRYLIRAGRLRARRHGRDYAIRRRDLARIRYGRPGPRPKAGRPAAG